MQVPVNDSLENNWRTKTVEDLEHDYWQETNLPTKLVERCYELRKMQLNKFLTEDLRIMIGQQIGLAYLIPLAIETLTDNLFAEGDFYPGDLLQNVLQVEIKFWEDHKHYWMQIDNLIKDKLKELKKENISTVTFYTVKL